MSFGVVWCCIFVLDLGPLAVPFLETFIVADNESRSIVPAAAAEASGVCPAPKEDSNTVDNLTRWQLLGRIRRRGGCGGPGVRRSSKKLVSWCFRNGRTPLTAACRKSKKARRSRRRLPELRHLRNSVQNRLVSEFSVALFFPGEAIPASELAGVLGGFFR